jgi:pimeloyl-ACP methyl ester carboxylesterase
MATTMTGLSVNGVRLYYEEQGSGEPLVLVHGSWTDATSWRFVVPGLAEAFRVLVYDRRGHSRSERPDAPGSVDEDGDDLAALLEALGLAPAHVVTSSFGGNIALRLATRRPDVFRSLSCHEPPLWSLLEADAASKETLEQARAGLEAVGRRIAEADHVGAARQFVEEIAFGPGAWENELPPETRAVFVRNAPTFLDELQDPAQLRIDREALSRLAIPVRLTQGSESLPVFSRAIDRLMELIPRASRETIEGAAHVPQLTTPERYVAMTARALRQHAATPATGRRVNGVRLYHEEHGSGAPILCVHGAGGTALGWAGAVDKLARLGRVIAYDRRGCARSERPQPYKRTSIGEHADDAAALLDALTAVPAVVVGRSYGGTVAADLALRYPDRVRALVLLEPDAPRELAPAAAVWVDALADRLRRTAAREGVDAVAEALMREVAGQDAWRSFPDEVRQLLTGNGAAILAELEGEWWLGADSAALATIRQPALLIAAADSPPEFREPVEALARALPNARTALVGGGHLIDPAAAEVTAFIEEVLGSH